MTDAVEQNDPILISYTGPIGEPLALVKSKRRIIMDMTDEVEKVARNDDMIPVRRELLGAVNAILKRSGNAGTATAKEFIPLAMSPPDDSVARIVALEEALRPFAAMRKSTEAEVSDLVRRSPAQEMRRRAHSIEQRDAEIDAARKALTPSRIAQTKP